MAKRHARVKLSRAQKLENERNRWMARKDAAIEMLVKSIGKLKELNRSVAREEKRSAAARQADQTPTPRPAGDSAAKVLASTPEPTRQADVAPRRPVSAEGYWAGIRAAGDGLDPLDIPANLKREPPRQVMASGDKELEEVVDAARNGDDKAKTALRIRKLKVGQERKQAELTGKRRKMPLTGKAALAAIAETPEAREARMKSLGFRKTKK